MYFICDLYSYILCDVYQHVCVCFVWCILWKICILKNTCIYIMILITCVMHIIIRMHFSCEVYHIWPTRYRCCSALQCIVLCCSVFQCVAVCHTSYMYDVSYDPLTEKTMIECPDWTVFPSTRLSDGDSDYTGSPFTHVKTCLKFWGLPRKRVWYVRRLLWKLVDIFGGRNYFKSDFLSLRTECVIFKKRVYV